MSCRRRALELVYAMVNESNIKTLTKELLDYLRVSDAEFKPDLTSKICMLVQRFAPDKQWHLDSLVQVCPETAAASVMLIYQFCISKQGISRLCRRRSYGPAQNVASKGCLNCRCILQGGPLLLRCDVSTQPIHVVVGLLHR